jgi:predicted small metal-binding protein
LYEFRCGSPVCRTHFTAQTKDAVMAKVADHVVHRHRIPAPTASLVAFVEANCVREVAASGRAG